MEGSPRREGFPPHWPPTLYCATAMGLLEDI